MPRVQLPGPPAGGPAPAPALTLAPAPATGASLGLVAAANNSNSPTPNAVIPGTDFTIIDRPKRRAIVLVFGDGGMGKTTFGLKYTPQPAFLIGFDGRSDYVEEEMKALGFPIPAVQIAPPSVLQKSDNVKVAAGEALRKFFKNYDGAIEASKTGKVRTITIDTVSELGEIITLAVRGTLDVVKDYGRSKDQINQIWWKVFGAARFIGNAHVIMLARASSIWENNEPTGDFRARVNDTVRDAVDFSLHIRLGISGVLAGGLAVGLTGVLPGGLSSGLAAGPTGLLPAIPNTQPKEFELVVKKSGNTNPTQDLNLVFRQADWGDDGPFVYACTRLMPRSVPGDWK